MTRYRVTTTTGVARFYAADDAEAITTARTYLAGAERIETLEQVYSPTSSRDIDVPEYQRTLATNTDLIRSLMDQAQASEVTGWASTAEQNRALYKATARLLAMHDRYEIDLHRPANVDLFNLVDLVAGTEPRPHRA